MFRSLCLLLFCFSQSFSGHGQARIQGKADTYKGEYVVLHRLADAITGERIFLEKQLVNNEGLFSFTTNENEVTPFYLSIGSQTALLYVEPNCDYEIVFPAQDANSFQRFEGSEVSVEIKNRETNDLNSLIRNFNGLYREFINKHYYDFAAGAYAGNEGLKAKINGGDKDAEKDTLPKTPSQFPEIVLQFKNRIDEQFEAEYDQSFFKEYIDYSISEIELLAGLQRKYYYENYFMSRKLPYRNPAFGSAFKLFYKNGFTDASKERQTKIVKAVNLEKSSAEMLEVFADDSLTKSLEIRALVCLYILSEAKTKSALQDQAVNQTLQDFAENSAWKEVAQIASHRLNQRLRHRAGWLVEDFTLADSKGNKWSWYAQQEAKPTYFLFFATWSATSLKEVAMLQKLQLEFGDAIHFVVINMDKDVELMKKYISEHREQKFVFLSGLADPLLGAKMNVRSIPHAVWVDGEGRIMVDYARKPSEGLQVDFQKYMAHLKENGKTGVKSWKGQ